MEILEGLNEQQKEAVRHIHGPLLVIAGAGTGKTTIITRRIAYLIATKQAKPKEILALTFTDKAANEMEKRVDVLVPYSFNDVWISTFHSFCDKILKEEGEKIGIPPDFQILSFPEACVFLQEHIFEFDKEIRELLPLSEPERHIPTILQTISRAKDENISSDEYLEFAKKNLNENDRESKKQYEMACIYKKYEELKWKYNFLDFGDLINLTINLFKQSPEVLEKYQKNYKFILVDEFQDTNYSQFELLKLLTSKENKNICVVADDDQSIYKFRGACMSNVILFKNTYPEAKIITITQNYRSTQTILDSAYRLISHNNPDRLEVKYKIDKKLKSNTSSPGKNINFYHFDTVESEADFVANLIKEKIEKGNYNYKDFAILLRVNDLANEFIKSLSYYDIPYIFSGGRSLIDNREIRLFLDILKVINDPYDSKSLYNLMASKLIYNFDMKSLALIAHTSSEKNRSIYQIVNELDNYESLKKELTQDDIEKIKIMLNDIKVFIEKSRESSPGHLLYSFLKEKSYIEKLAKAQSILDIERAQNAKIFFDLIDNYIKKINPYSSLKNLIHYLTNLSETVGEWQYEGYDYDIDAVNVLTVHKAKGLEFRVVFICGLAHGKFPQRKKSEFIELPQELIKDVAISEDYHLQEERRLFYVAMTRAKEELYLTSARDYKTRREWKISQFVYEALDLTPQQISIEKVPSKDIFEKMTFEEQALPQLLIPEKIELSAYKIDDYLTCPLKYKFIHIINIPIRRHYIVTFGEVIHEVIKFIHNSKKQNKKITEEDVKLYYNKNWLSEGFISREHEERMFKEGLIIIENYLKKCLEEQITPLEVEGEFKFMFDENTTIRGRWDRLDLIDQSYIITDYKVSKVQDEKEANKKTRENKQLLIYALGHKHKFNCYPSLLQLYFLESNTTGKTKPTEKNMNDITSKIQEVIKGIKDKNFQPKPDYHNCSYCPYHSICEASYKTTS